MNNGKTATYFIALILLLLVFGCQNPEIELRENELLKSLDVCTSALDKEKIRHNNSINKCGELLDEDWESCKAMCSELLDETRASCTKLLDDCYSIEIVSNLYWQGYEEARAFYNKLLDDAYDLDYICNINAYNCADFSTHSEAQKVFELCGGLNNDIHHLDGDYDGLACETLDDNWDNGPSTLNFGLF